MKMEMGTKDCLFPTSRNNTYTEHAYEIFDILV
jgi:hypothetical protein